MDTFLVVALSTGLVSLLATTYAVLRLLLPLVPPHPLSRLRAASPLPRSQPSKPIRLKSAQRFQVRDTHRSRYATAHSRHLQRFGLR
jgi:hypothetical protein